MTEIRIDNTGDGTWWLYVGHNSWKDYVCDDFDEHVVVFGNRDFNSYTEASWFNLVKDIMNEIDCDYDALDICEDYHISQEQYKSLKEIYNKARNLEDTYCHALQIIFPDEKFEAGTIRGYTQGEWSEYIIKGDVDTNLLESFYFCQVADIAVINDEEEYGDVITHDELWKAERDGLVDFFRKRFDINDNEEIQIFKADGYKRVIDWQKVS